jgi:hypothetical protein
MNSEIGNTIMVRLERNVHKKVEDMKIIPREPMSDCIMRVFTEYEKLTKSANITPPESQNTPK